MLASQAYRILDDWLQCGWSRCTNHVSMASPIGRDDFAPIVGSDVSGLVIHDDIMLTFGQNDLDAFDSQVWRDGQTAIASSPFWRRKFERARLRLKVHGAVENYFADAAIAVT